MAQSPKGAQPRGLCLKYPHSSRMHPLPGGRLCPRAAEMVRCPPPPGSSPWASLLFFHVNALPQEQGSLLALLWPQPSPKCNYQKE